MKKENYFVGVRFNNDKELFYKMKNDDLGSSDLIRKSLYLYFKSLEDNNVVSGSVDDSTLTIMNNQISFLQNQIEFLQQQNAFLTLPWYKKIIHRLEPKHE